MSQPAEGVATSNTEMSTVHPGPVQSPDGQGQSGLRSNIQAIEDIQRMMQTDDDDLLDTTNVSLVFTTLLLGIQC